MWWRKHPTLWVTLALMVTALAIISSHRRDPGSLSLLERSIYALVRPVQSGLAHVLSAARSTWEDYITLVNAQKENRRLAARIQELEQEMAECREIRASNARLETLLNFQSSMRMPSVVSRVIGEDSSGWFHTLLIDKGTRDGVERAMPVVAREGLVGHVVESADRTAKVLLITDRNSAVDVLLQESRTRAVLEGVGRHDVCVLKYVPRSETVQKGEMVITSGLGGIYPKGLLVGNVAEVWKEGYGLFQRVEVSPKVDFQRLEEVLVILKGEPSEAPQQAGEKPSGGQPRKGSR